MEIFPTYGHVLCLQLDTTAIQTGIIYEKEELPIYKIIKCSDIADDNSFNINDIILVNSIPTKAVIDSKIYYIIKIDNIIGKIYE